MKRKVFFVLPTLHAGGAERVISFVAQNLSKERFDTTLIIVGLETESKFDITDVPVIFLNKTRVLNSAFVIPKLIIRHKPDIIVSSIVHLNALMGWVSIFFRKPVFIGRQAGITGVLKYNNKPKKGKGLMTRMFNYYTFGVRLLDHFICQSNDMRKNIVSKYGVKDKFVTVINNPITQTDKIKEKQTSGEIKKYVTVGRLSQGKGHIRVLRALSKLSFPFQYTIIGEGSYYNTIVEEVRSLGLSDNVDFIEYTSEVPKHLIESDMFLQGSYSEGFPNALLESCAVGTPVIAFRAPGGTKEIVENEVNGFLVEDEDEFFDRLNDNRAWHPEKVRASVYKKFNKAKIINDYEDLFDKVLK